MTNGTPRACRRGLTPYSQVHNNLSPEARYKVSEGANICAVWLSPICNRICDGSPRPARGHLELYAERQSVQPRTAANALSQFNESVAVLPGCAGLNGGDLVVGTAQDERGLPPVGFNSGIPADGFYVQRGNSNCASDWRKASCP